MNPAQPCGHEVGSAGDDVFSHWKVDLSQRHSIHIDKGTMFYEKQPKLDLKD